jgi:hypothetical protein
MEETTTNAGKETAPAEEMQASRQIGRRQLLRTLAASSGVVAASALVPGKWSKPLVEVGLLPAHAQVTPSPTMTSTPTATPTGTQTPTVTPTATPTDTPTLTRVPCVPPETPTQTYPPDDETFNILQDSINITFTWETVDIPPGCEGVTYGIEVEWRYPSYQWEWKGDAHGLTSPTWPLLLVPGAYRWRVWASTTVGDSPRSDPWWYFQVVFPQ